ncbi:MAG: hypothetical protein ACXW50_24970 [Candidatus Binatia bacterium]
MAKVIVERPRRGASGRLKGRLRGNWEAQPIKQGMKFLLADTKSLNENLAPLRRRLVNLARELQQGSVVDELPNRGRKERFFSARWSVPI